MLLEELQNRIEKRLKSHLLDLILKRIFDMVVSAILLVLLLPVMFIIVLFIKLDSKGPGIFIQKRVGWNGKPFTVFKFRTMVNNAENLFKLDVNSDNIGSLVFQDKGDTRITKVGSFLRRTSLDELPQLLNVLIGNMSIVGPRPEIPQVADYYDDTQKMRLCMKPGITGLAQVSGRGEIELDETIKYDLEYIQKFSFLRDLKIILKTIYVVFKGEGAY